MVEINDDKYTIINIIINDNYTCTSIELMVISKIINIIIFHEKMIIKHIELNLKIIRYICW